MATKCKDCGCRKCICVKLEPGWLARQMEAARKEVATWPESVKALRHINDGLKRGNKR